MSRVGKYYELKVTEFGRLPRVNYFKVLSMGGWYSAWHVLYDAGAENEVPESWFAYTREIQITEVPLLIGLLKVGQ